MAAQADTPSGTPPRAAPSSALVMSAAASAPAPAANRFDQLVLSAISEPPLVTGSPAMQRKERRGLATTTDHLPTPKRARCPSEAESGSASLSLLAAEALRQMAPVAAGAPPPAGGHSATPAALSPTAGPSATAFRRPLARSETAAGAASMLLLLGSSLAVTQQPPPRVVYKRILKPFPSVALTLGPAAAGRVEQLGNLFVEAVLVDDVRRNVVLPHLEGTRTARITAHAPAVFNKLKIQCTSQMLRGKESSGKVRLSFVLKHFTGTVFETIGTVHALSHPMEIFSHTLYLSADGSSAPVPLCNEILPAVGKVAGGTRCAILGEGFDDKGPALGVLVQFGDAPVVKARYHESGTILVTAPAVAKRGPVPVRVSNDGSRWSTPPLRFEYV